jgi:predicted dienelactone hydrolase
MIAKSISRYTVLLALSLLPLPSTAADKEASYHPLAAKSEGLPAPLELTVKDAARQRELPIRIFLPAGTYADPVVLFSHGLGGSREGSAYLGKHWSARGYVCVFLQHPGSDTSVWQGKPVTEILGSMKKALTVENFVLRTKDVSVVLDQITKWNWERGHPLYGRIDMSHVGMSGHSFGAVTTQAVSGQLATSGKARFTEPRIKAAIMFSPSSPTVGTAKQVFAQVKIPWMLMTGTKDVVPMLTNTDVKSRLAVFAALPPGGKYEVVLDRAEHSAFTDRPLPGDSEKRNPNHHRVILALSTAFWDAYLKNDAAAKAWLDSDGPKSVLEKDDKWQKK